MKKNKPKISISNPRKTKTIVRKQNVSEEAQKVIRDNRDNKIWNRINYGGIF